MVAVGEDGPMPVRDAIHGECQAGGNRLHAAPERIAIVGFDDEVGVVALQRVVHEAKTGPCAAGRERALDLVHDRYGAERRDVGAYA